MLGLSVLFGLHRSSLDRSRCGGLLEPDEPREILKMRDWDAYSGTRMSEFVNCFEESLFIFQTVIKSKILYV